MHIVEVVDDDPDFRVLARLQDLGYEVRAHGSAGEFLYDMPREVGCLLLEAGLPGQSGLQLQEALIARGHQVPIVFLSGSSDISICAKAFKSGAVDFLAKPIVLEKLEDAVQTAFALAERNRHIKAKEASLRLLYESLTDDEKAVTRQVLRGKLNKQIAWQFGVSERTIKKHRANVLKKMGVPALPQLIRAMILLHGIGAVE